MKDNIYIKINKDWEHENKIKYGYVEGDKKKLIQRLKASIEEHSELSEFEKIYEIEKTEEYKLPIKQIDKIISILSNNKEKIEDIEKYYDIKLPLLKEIKKYLIESKTKKTNEFLKRDGIKLLDKIIKTEFILLGLKLVKEYKKDEIIEINKSVKDKNNRESLELKKIEWVPKELIKKKVKEKKEEFIEREYQKDIIEYGIKEIEKNKKLYLELATGGGKSYIIYKIMNEIKPENIIIFSPRKNINKQNSSEKYLSILGNEYLCFNYSKNKNFTSFYKKCKKNNKKMIIVACPQNSNEKIYNIIKKHELKDIFVWYDEAHHTIENWINSIDKTNIKFFLQDNTIINYRCFSSASPNKNRFQNILIFLVNYIHQ